MMARTDRIPAVLVGLLLIFSWVSVAVGASMERFYGPVEALTVHPHELGKEWRIDIDAIIEDLPKIPQIEASKEDTEFAMTMIAELRKLGHDFKIKAAANLTYYRKDNKGKEEIFDLKIIVFESSTLCKAAWEFMYPKSQTNEITYLTALGDAALKRNDGKLAFRRANVYVSAYPLVSSEKTTYLAKAFDARILSQLSLSIRPSAISPDKGSNGEDVPVFTDQDLQKYKKTSTRFEEVQHKDTSKQSASDESKKNINYQHLLAGTWSSRDENHESIFTLSPDGTFQGVTKKQNTITWKYSGTWHVSADRLIWTYKDNTPQRRSPGSQDNDEIVTVDDDEFIIQEGRGGMLNQFYRVK